MRPEPRRRFTLVDAMILVAATAGAMAWVRANYEWRVFELTWGWYYRRGYYVEFVQDLIRLAWPFLLAWTLATLVLRTRPPRPAPRRLARQPGLVAGCAVVVGAAAVAWPAVVGALAGLYQIDPLTHQPASYWVGMSRGVGLPEAVGLAVTAAWLTLALGGRWRPEPSWIDRAGRALGACWIVLLAARGALQFAALVRQA
jgi:hypothetical protein